MSLATTAVDHQQRIDFDRLRRYRLERIQSSLAQHGLDAVLCFDYDNVRYSTSSYQCETWRDKMYRYSLVPANGDPTLFCSRTLTFVNRYPERYPWLVGKVRNSEFTWRGAYYPESPRADSLMRTVKATLAEAGLANTRVGVDIADMEMLAAAERAGLRLVNGQQAMLDARLIKSSDEVELMRIGAAIAEGAFWEFSKWMRPGVRESEMVALLSSECYKRGAERVDFSVATGPNTNPHSSLFSDRIVRPGEVVYLDIQTAYNGYRTCYYRSFVAGQATAAHRDVYKKGLGWLQDSIDAVRDGVTTADIASRWPSAIETGSFGVKDETTAFALQLGHGLGMGLWEKPIITREVSLDHPIPIEAGMVFALETYAGSDDGRFGVRVEEEVLVTKNGCEILTQFPIETITECSG